MRLVLSMLPLAAGYFLSYLFRNVNSVIAADIMRDLGIGADELGLLTSVYFLTFAAAQLPVGVWLDRYGPRRVQCTLLLCAAAGSALCALSAGFTGLLLGRALIGLGTAGGLAAGLKSSAEWFPRERLALVNGGYIMCGGLGALAATYPVEFALRFRNWQELLLMLAIAAGATAMSVGVLVPRRDQAKAEEPVSATLKDVFRDPLFRRFAPLSGTCFGSVLAVQGLWAGPWLADVDGFTRPEVARDLAAMALVLVAAAPLWGLLVQRLRGWMSLLRLAGWSAVLMITTEFLVLTTHGGASVAGWCCFAVFGGMTVLSYSVLADHFPRAAIGRANGALNMLHIGCSFVVQFGVGQIVALWPGSAGHYPAQAYRAGLLLPVALQALALAWFVCPMVSRRLLVALPADGPRWRQGNR